MKNTMVFVLLFALLFSSALVLCACGSEKESVQTETPDADPVTETEIPETERISDWDSADVIWRPNVDIDFELRVRPGENFVKEPVEDFSCNFISQDGETVFLSVDGLYYNNDYEAMIGFFKSKAPEKLLEGKTSMTLVEVYDENSTEVVSKLSEIRCLTSKGRDLETLREFFSKVIIRVEGTDYIPIPQDEEYETLFG